VKGSLESLSLPARYSYNRLYISYYLYISIDMEQIDAISVATHSLNYTAGFDIKVNLVPPTF